jgi:hypothetical protein
MTAVEADVRMGEGTQGRIVTRISPKLQVVHARLDRWGRWMCSEVALRRAWPSETLLSRVIEGGPDWATARGAPSDGEIPNDVARVNEAVDGLEGLEKLVTREYYLTWWPTDVIARELRIGRRMFDAALERARWQVRGYLVAVEKRKV